MQPQRQTIGSRGDGQNEEKEKKEFEAHGIIAAVA